MKVSILGAGSWGTALAKILCDNGHKVVLWGRNKEYMEKLEKSRCNERYLKEFSLPNDLHLSADLFSSLQKSDLIVNATPVQYTRKLFLQIQQLSLPLPPVINSSKGLEIDTLKRVSEIIAEIFGEDHPFAVISGPSHAEEVMKSLPTTVSIASKNKNFAKLLQDSFMNDSFRVYTSVDVVGVEFGGALKNIFAIAVGAIDGINLGDNTKAALITRGIAEMIRIGTFFGGKAETFSGLSGIGDLIVTCFSGFSRNRFVGECLGKGKNLAEIRREMGYSIAEGVTTVKSIYELIKKHKLEAPIIEESYRVIYHNLDIKIALKNLMLRDAKAED